MAHLAFNAWWLSIGTSNTCRGDSYLLIQVTAPLLMRFSFDEWSSVVSDALRLLVLNASSSVKNDFLQWSELNKNLNFSYISRKNALNLLSTSSQSPVRSFLVSPSAKNSNFRSLTPVIFYCFKQTLRDAFWTF